MVRSGVHTFFGKVLFKILPFGTMPCTLLPLAPLRYLPTPGIRQFRLGQACVRIAGVGIAVCTRNTHLKNRKGIEFRVYDKGYV